MPILQTKTPDPFVSPRHGERHPLVSRPIFRRQPGRLLMGGPADGQAVPTQRHEVVAADHLPVRIGLGGKHARRRKSPGRPRRWAPNVPRGAGRRGPRRRPTGRSAGRPPLSPDRGSRFPRTTPGDDARRRSSQPSGPAGSTRPGDPLCDLVQVGRVQGPANPPFRAQQIGQYGNFVSPHSMEEQGRALGPAHAGSDLGDFQARIDRRLHAGQFPRVSHSSRNSLRQRCGVRGLGTGSSPEYKGGRRRGEGECRG